MSNGSRTCEAAALPRPFCVAEVNLYCYYNACREKRRGGDDGEVERLRLSGPDGCEKTKQGEGGN